MHRHYRPITAGILLLVTALLVTGPVFAQEEEEPDLGTEAQREAGGELYAEKCAQCHGETGAGDGIAAELLRPPPRDFTRGIYKIRSTASGQLPTTEDIEEVIREGMPHTSMPAWQQLSDGQIENLTYFLKTFNDDFAGPYGTPETVEIPDPPSYSEERAERGRTVYVENQCYDCHGQRGRGDGESAPTLETDLGHHIYPADMTKRWTFKGGTSRQDIYRTFTTGMDGSPMPSYDIPEEDRWALVDYVYSLSRDEPNYATFVTAVGRDEEIDLSDGDAVFEGAPEAYFPLFGQVIEPGRNFHTPTAGVTVRAAYDEDEIAFELSWHTMTADTTGSNDPTLTVPPVEERIDTTADYAATRDPETAYSDAVALQLQADSTQGEARPYFLFGDPDNPVDLWFADMAGTGIRHLVGRGSGNVQPGTDSLQITRSYEAGEWTVRIKGPRRGDDGLAMSEGGFYPVAFSIWDGFNEERGTKRAVSSWYDVYLRPTDQQPASVPVAGYAGLTLLVELGLVFLVRRRFRRKEKAEPAEPA